jgi:hypothetical protein
LTADFHLVFEIAEIPIKIKSDMEDVTMDEGDVFTVFTVEYSKVLAQRHKIICKFNGHEIVSGDKYEIKVSDNKLELRVKNICPEDEGTYTIQVQNAKSSAFLTVNGI